MSSTATQKKQNRWIVVLSIAIPLVVALLFGVKIPGAKPLTFLPPIYATINGITAILLITALWMIKTGKRNWHERLMKTCLILSALFLILYIAYHSTSTPTRYGGVGALRYFYYFTLISHILLSIAVIPLVLITYVRALGAQFDKHRKLAKIAFPLWLYVAVSGVGVYLLIAPYY